MSTTTGWATGITWSLRRHAVRPGSVPVARDQFMAACNSGTAYIAGQSARIPSHVKKAQKVPNCMRCEKILAREADTTFGDLAEQVA